MPNSSFCPNANPHVSSGLKSVEEKFSASAKEFEDFYDHAPFGYHAANSDGTFLWINSTELSWLGYKRDELVGKKAISDFFKPAYETLFQPNFSAAIECGMVINKEYDLVCKDGTIKRVFLNVTAINDKDGYFLQSQTVVHDITELKLTQDNLKQLAINRQEILDHQLVGSIKTTTDHIISWGNRGMDHIFGYEPNELDGKPTRILYPDDSSYLAMAENAYPIIKAHGIYRAQSEMLRKDGKKIWIAVNAMPLNENEELWTLTDISSIMNYQEKIERIAYHDILTDLPNRLLIKDRLDQALAQAKRTSEIVAVCYLDLDDFKPINDKYGHAAGDKLLKVIAQRMQDLVRFNDTVGRLGGDEFVLLLTNLTDAVEFQMVLERILELINKPIVLESCEVTISVSIGVSLFPRDTDDPDILLSYADQAMYHAKKTGRNRIHLFCAGSGLENN